MAILESVKLQDNHKQRRNQTDSDIQERRASKEQYENKNKKCTMDNKHHKY